VKEIAAHPALLLGLIGAPITHSASPAMHEAAAAELGIRAYYHLIEARGADRADLRLMLEGVRRLGFAGINVTFPYKEAAVPLLDELSPAAAAIGAVNTIVVRKRALVGYNTDASGFARALDELGEPALTRPVALIGAGGVGSRKKALPRSEFLIAIVPRWQVSRKHWQHARRCALPRAWRKRFSMPAASSTEPRSACCPTARARCRSACCETISGWRRRSTLP